MRPVGAEPPSPRHAHVARVPGGLLVTIGERRMTVTIGSGRPGADAEADAGAGAGDSGALRAALEERLGPLVTWPAGGGPGPGVAAAQPVWWWGGAWYGSHPDDEDDARRVVRTHAPDADGAQAWSTAGLDLGLPTAVDPDLELVRGVVGDLPRGTLLRCAGGRFTRHQLHPWPLLDRVTGAARSIAVRPAEPGLPPRFRHIHAVLPRTELGWSAWQTDRLAPAAAFASPSPTVPDDEAPDDAAPDDDEAGHDAAGRDAAGHDAAVRAAALTSAVSHLAGPWTGTAPVRLAAMSELDAAGEMWLHPDALAVTDPAVLAHAASPLVPVDADAALAWIHGERCVDGRPVWAPLRFVHLHTDPPPVLDQPTSAFHNFAGLAAGPTREEAVERGIGHVVAQDAMARWWRAADAPSLSSVAVPAALDAAWAGAEVGLELRRVPSRFDLHVVLAVLHDPRHDLIGLGNAAAADLAVAAERAVLEALVQLVSARDLDRVGGRIRAAAADGLGEVAGLLPHRPGRAYLDGVPPGPGDWGIAPRPALVDPMVNLQVGLDPRVQARVRHRLSSGPGRPDERGRVDPRVEAVVVDTTPPPLRDSGLVAVRVLHPRCLRLEPGAFPVRPPRWGTAEQTPFPGW
ncbi:MAG: YcaO-like family protein [Phycicoccus sp.]